MADVAQLWADVAIYEASAVHKSLKKLIDTSAMEANHAVTKFDELFSYTYHGGPMLSYADAWKWRDGTGRHIRPTYPYVGGAGFRADFKDSGREPSPIGGPDADQTHHFSAYLSLGINGLWPIKKYHEWGDNSGDQNLGRAAYYLGEQLRKRKFQLKNIGNYVRTSICSGPGRGF
jgi:hypothetical protein